MKQILYIDIEKAESLKDGKVCIDKDDFVKEHKNLVKTLKKGSKKKRNKEAKDQEEELNHIIKAELLYIEKAHVKQYEKKTKSGKLVVVEQHEDKRQKKAKTDTKKVKIKKIKETPEEKIKNSANPWIRKFGHFNLYAYPPKEATNVIVWNNGNVSPKDADKNWVLKMTGTNEKGKWEKRYYTKAFMNRNADVKWERNDALVEPAKEMIQSAYNDLIEGSEKKKQCALAVLIMFQTGLRISRDDIKEVTGNRGVATLNSSNIKFGKNNETYFEFQGKNDKLNKAILKDKDITTSIKFLAEKNKDKDKIFDVSNHEIQRYYDGIGGADFVIKDIRTLFACVEANNFLESKDISKKLKMISDKNSKTGTKAIGNILKECYAFVSEKLNNTPNMAKNNYISPKIVKEWCEKNGINPNPHLKNSEVKDEFTKES
jgi:DNA topoisomerase IB